MSQIIAFVIKTCLIFTFTFLLARILSKKTMSQLSAFELAGIVIFSNVASQPIGTTSLMTTIFGLFLISFLIIFAGKFVLINKFSSIFEDIPTVLVENGKIDFRALKREFMSLNQFTALLREQGYDSVSDIDYVILEPSGEISVFPLPQKNPVTLEDLNLSPGVRGITIPIIMDGKIIIENLNKTPYSKEDILNYINKNNIKKLSDIVLGEVKPNGKIIVFKRECINEGI